MECCCAAEAAGWQYWQQLQLFTLGLPCSIFHGASFCAQQLLFALRAIVTALWSAIYSAAASVLVPILWLFTNNATLIVVGLSLFILWQTYYPSKWTLRLLSQLQFCQGITFEFPPPDESKNVLKYVALTLDGGPCPYNTEPVLDLLAEHECKATFFVCGSQVETCDALGVGNGHAELGKATLRRMVAEGHELGNQAWNTRPSHIASPKQLSQEVADMHKLISSTRLVALAAGEYDKTQPQQLSSFRRRRWFRPAGGWFNPAMLDAVQQLGYTMVLGSVFPWDTHIKWPLLNAVYIWSKVYSGAVIVLHDRRKHLLPTLQYVLPWLRWCGYQVVTLGEAASYSSQGQAELTSDALTAHNEALGSSNSLQGLAALGQGLAAAGAAAGAQMSSSGSGAAVTASKPESLVMSPDKLKNQGRERAALTAAAEEEGGTRSKAAKRAQADKRAGIDRRLADMSAAEKRAIERREREKKEAEKRRARRKAEEITARERYDTYLRQKAQDEVQRREAEAAAAAKAQQDEERKRIAMEAYMKRQEAERAAAAELRARLQAEREAAAAAEVEAAAAGGDASLAKDSWAGSSVSGSVTGDKKQLKAKFGGFMKKLGGKLGSKKQGSSKAADQSSTAAAAAAAAAGVAAVSLGGAAAAAIETPRLAGAAGVWEGPAAAAVSADSSHHRGTVAAAGLGSSSAVFGDTTYAWYGLTPGPDSQATLAKIDAVLVQQKAAITEAMQAAAAAAAAAMERPSQAEQSFSFDTTREHSFAGRAAAAATAYEAGLPAPAVGRYALGPTGKVLFGFDAQPLLLSEGPDAQAVVLNSQGEAVTGPGGEQIALLLGALEKPLVDPHDRPVMCALDPNTGRPLGVHPDGSIVMVPAAPGYIPASAAAAGAAAAAAAAGAEKDSAVGAAGDAAAEATSSDASSSIKEAGSYAPSYAPSLARTSSHMSGATANTVGAASNTAPPSIASSAVAGELHQLPAEAAPFSSRATAAATEDAAAAVTAAVAVAVPAQVPVMVPAELLLGPHGMPLLGLDNRPLIVAVDEEGVPLVLGPEGSVLLNPPDDLPLQLAFSSDGSLVALDSQCRPLTGPDGNARVVALDRHRRPMVDESGRPVLLTLGPNGLPLPDSHAPSGRVSWAGSASGARLSHSGTQGNLALAAGPGTGLEVMVGDWGGSGVVDAADYGQYSAASLGFVGCPAPAGAGPEGAEERQLSFSHERVLQQRLLVQEEEEMQQAGAAGDGVVPAVSGAYAAAGCRSVPAAAAAALPAAAALSAVSAVAAGTDETAAAAAADDDVSAAHSISRDQADKLSGAVPAAAADGLEKKTGQLYSGVTDGGAPPSARADGETLPVKAAGPLVHDQQSVELTASATLELAAAAAAANSLA